MTFDEWMESKGYWKRQNIMYMPLIKRYKEYLKEQGKPIPMVSKNIEQGYKDLGKEVERINAR